MFCPHKDCTHSADSGFSRQANLKEHIRRVHRGVGMDAFEFSDRARSIGKSSGTTNRCEDSQRTGFQSLESDERKKRKMENEA